MPYIYIIQNAEWVNRYKYGYTTCPVTRIREYRTYSVYPFKYIKIYELAGDFIYHKLQNKCYDIVFSTIAKNANDLKGVINYHNYNFPLLCQLKPHLLYEGGGIEFIASSGIELLEQIIINEFMHLGPHYIRTLTVDELSAFNEIKILNAPLFDELMPFDYQAPVVAAAVEYFKIHNVGKIIWACGLGKALLSLFIARALNAGKILIGVPWRHLQTQMYNEAVKLYNADDILLIGGEISDADTIAEFIKNKKIVITTYHSCYKLLNYKFDFKIGDECHHLANVDDIKNDINTDIKNDIKNDINANIKNDINANIKNDIKNADIKNENINIKNENINININIKNENINENINININTADINNIKNDINVNIKNDIADIQTVQHTFSGCLIENQTVHKQFINFHEIRADKTLFLTATEKISPVFGDLIDAKDFDWAISQKKITDYTVIILRNKESEKDYIMKSLKAPAEDAELVISAFMMVKAMESRAGITHALVYTNKIETAEKVCGYINELSKWFCICIHSQNTNSKTLKLQLEKFKEAPKAIICSAYMLGEGTDLPIIDTVLFAEQMNSGIRIVQSVFRAHRLDKARPDKHAYVIIPCIGRVDNNNIINILREIDHGQVYDKLEHGELYDGAGCDGTIFSWVCKFEKEGTKLDMLRLELLKREYIKNNKIDVVKNWYEALRVRNKEMGITKKSQYYIRAAEYDDLFVELPDIYFRQYWKNWTIFFGDETEYAPFNEFINICKSHNKYMTADEYEKLNDARLPPRPGEYYDRFHSFELQFARPRLLKK